jgi:signal transduction histidine kinase
VVEHDGIPRTLLIAVSPLRRDEHCDDDALSFEGAIAVVRDVTDLRVLERTRQEFFTNVSHELKTPITAIRGALETVVTDREMPTDVRDRFLANAQQHSLRLSTLVNDLLSLARLERDPHTLPREPVELVTLAGEVLEGAEPMAERAGITLELFVGAMSVVKGDEEALRQAITNLVDNAIAHSPPEQTVTVAVSDDGGVATIAVRDTGEGIPAAALERVFERFYRVDAARSRARGGTGIGLSIVKHVAQAHGGSVQVSSEPGRGSEFTLRIPVSRAPRLGTPERR